jgi:hypothetical protein
MADAKVTALSAISAVALADLLYVVDDVGGTPTSTKATITQLMAATGLVHTAGTDADTTMAVGCMYVVDMSAWATADRTYTLPGTAAVGDRVGITVSAGDASHELIITAASGDTLNAIAGGMEWSRVFITGEVVIMRCVAADATWMVEYDGRIPQKGLMDLTTASDGNNSNVYYRPTQTSVAGVWTSRIDVGSVVSTANDYMLVRRAGNYQVSIGFVPKDTPTTGHAVNARFSLNGSQEESGPSNTANAAAVNRCAASKLIAMAAGDHVLYEYRTETANVGAGAARNTYMSIHEVLP